MNMLKLISLAWGNIEIRHPLDKRTFFWILSGGGLGVLLVMLLSYFHFNNIYENSWFDISFFVIFPELQTFALPEIEQSSNFQSLWVWGHHCIAGVLVGVDDGIIKLIWILTGNRNNLIQWWILSTSYIWMEGWLVKQYLVNSTFDGSPQQKQHDHLRWR